MLYAFFDQDGRLDRKAMRRQVEAVISQGVHGVAAGGLASETNKLSTAERRTIMEWVAEDVGGRLPISFTIAETSVHGQAAMVRTAHELGAQWVVLQPPPVRSASEAALIDFYGAVASQSPLPVGIQNAPEYIGIGVSNAGFRTLNERHRNISILKAEGPATYVASLVEDTGGAFTVFNGRNGLELTDNFRAGCAGMIPGVDACDLQASIYEKYVNGQEEAADRGYADILPLLMFLMISIDHLLCYGKRLTARRLGLGEVHDRMPAQKPTDFGLAVLERWSAGLGPFS
jgi:4-hydroxy-tetrahydrodipicolinate synthase